MDLKDIKAIIDLMKKNSISEFELERQEFKIKLKRGAFGPSNDDLPTQIYAQPGAGWLPLRWRLRRPHRMKSKSSHP